MNEELTPVRCGCGGEAMIDAYLGDLHRSNLYYIYCAKCDIRTSNYLSEAEAVTAWNTAMGAKDINVSDKERTAKATRKPEAFFYRCECGYGLCCEKNDMNYCPHCGARLEWNE